MAAIIHRPLRHKLVPQIARMLAPLLEQSEEEITSQLRYPWNIEQSTFLALESVTMRPVARKSAALEEIPRLLQESRWMRGPDKELVWKPHSLLHFLAMKKRDPSPKGLEERFIANRLTSISSMLHPDLSTWDGPFIGDPCRGNLCVVNDRHCELLRDLIKEIEHDTDPAIRHLSTVAESILARITS